MKLIEQIKSLKAKYNNLDGKKHFQILGIFMVFYFVFQETLMYALTRSSFGSNFLLVLYFAILNGILLWGIVVLIPPKARRIITNILLVLGTVLICAQLVYHSFFRTYFILTSVGRGAQIVEFMDIILELIWNRLWAILLLNLPVIIFAFVISKPKVDYKKGVGKKRFLPLIVALVIGIAVHVTFFLLPKE